MEVGWVSQGEYSAIGTKWNADNVCEHHTGIFFCTCAKYDIWLFDLPWIPPSTDFLPHVFQTEMVPCWSGQWPSKKKGEGGSDRLERLLT